MAFKIEGLLERIGLNSRTPRLGIAFSGGGAKGFTHIGAMMAFETFGMKPDIVSGVSAGSIACTLYAAGLSPNDMMACFEEYDSFGAFAEVTLPKSGFFKMDRFAKLLDSWLPVKNLEELTIPTVVCATDIDAGKSVGWSKGEIVPRVIASCSIPIIFHPVRINGVNYVDGGVLRNLPAWAIRKHCRILYGLNCAPLDRDYHYKGSLLDITMRTYSLMSKSNTLQDLELCDYVVRSPGTRFGTFDLSALREAVRVGYDATCRVIEEALEKPNRKKN
ncbi:MAG: patatin-like phospholipase family protein [Muribaculaceae bacterium]|nr:patatin-like phospholipase family protein [Muribaculaceae bacterium]MDE7081474.1 patatin-like phospholipase family protein [Muribaculaceae bacterium]